MRDGNLDRDLNHRNPGDGNAGKPAQEDENPEPYSPPCALRKNAFISAGDTTPTASRSRMPSPMAHSLGEAIWLRND